jgi:hypothetical protein
MMRVATAFVIAALGAFALPAGGLAQTQEPPAPPADEASRFAFHRSGDGYVRLDARTGQVSQCTWRGAGWACNAAADERTALESEIARLQQENAALKKSMLARGVELPSDVKPDLPPRKEPETGAVPKMPTDAELDRAFAFMKNVWKRLIEMMAELQRDMQRKS